MNIHKVRYRYRQITQARFLEQVGFLIKAAPHSMILNAYQPGYHIFYVPKRNGGQRLIESPTSVLKGIQRALTKYLNSFYCLHLPDASHGFIPTVKNRIHRSIVTNASEHLGAPYMMNIDMKDFFHSIKQTSIDRILLSDYFNFNSRTAKIISDLCCYQGRLPMGAPTSPVLSNVACIEMDRKLSSWAEAMDIKYTRYVDDMTFSSRYKPFTKMEYRAIEKILNKHKFTINPKKVKIFKPSDLKTITGIIVTGEKLSLPEKFFVDTRKEIERLKNLNELRYRYQIDKSEIVDMHKRSISGFIQFASTIYGDEAKEVRELNQSYMDALDNDPWIEPMSWEDFPYIYL